MLCLNCREVYMKYFHHLTIVLIFLDNLIQLYIQLYRHSYKSILIKHILTKILVLPSHLKTNPIIVIFYSFSHNEFCFKHILKSTLFWFVPHWEINLFSAPWERLKDILKKHLTTMSMGWWWRRWRQYLANNSTSNNPLFFFIIISMVITYISFNKRLM